MQEILKELTILVKDNPILATGISLYGMTVLTFLLRNVPKSIFDFIARQSTTSLTFNNSSWENDKQFQCFLKWVSEQKGFRFSRTLHMESRYKYSHEDNKEHSDTNIGVGFGKHFILYNKRPFFITLHKEESSGSEKIKCEITITSIGRSHEYIFDVVDSFKYRPDPSKIGVFTPLNGKELEWVRSKDANPRDLNTIIINDTLKDEIIKRITDFDSSEAWYHKRGISYKLGLVFYGEPGTGKTTLVKAISTHFKRNLYTFNINSLSSNAFDKLVREIPPKSILLIEDFDSCPGMTARNNSLRYKSVEEPSNEDEISETIDNPSVVIRTEASELSEMMGVDRQTILNTFDGICGLDGVIIIMTTNSLNNIDSAIMRKSRVDKSFKITLMQDSEVREYIRIMTDNQIIPSDKVIFEDISGAELQALFIDHKDDYEAFVSSIPVRKSFEESVEELLHPLKRALSIAQKKKIVEIKKDNTDHIKKVVNGE